MAGYGSGMPSWAASSNNNNNNNNNNNSYQPPTYSGSAYQEEQSKVVEDSLKTNYDAEGTAAAILSQMTTQRYQLQAAHDDVWEMREATEKAKKELEDMYAKSRAKKKRLHIIIAMLAITDAFLFLRLLNCGGSFIC